MSRFHASSAGNILHPPTSPGLPGTPVVVPAPDLPALSVELWPPLPVPPVELASPSSVLPEQPLRARTRVNTHESWKVFPMALDHCPRPAIFQAQRHRTGLAPTPNTCLVTRQAGRKERS